MGREIQRVPLDFDFPIGGSYHDACWGKHKASCSLDEHDDCDVNTSPPKGDGWQLWQTVSDGPISPVFQTPEELIDWMSQPDYEHNRKYHEGPYPRMPWGQGWRRETAEKFVRGAGWIPSFTVVGGRPQTTDETVDAFGAKK